MNNTYQLYLKLKKLEEGTHLCSLLEEVGFKNFKRTGSVTSHFRNYYFHIPDAPFQCEIQFRILPNETKVSTVAIQLYFACTPTTLKDLFDKLSELQIILPFQLLDLELRNRYYADLNDEIKINNVAIGLSNKEQEKVEQTAYIPLSFSEFQVNHSNVEKRSQFFTEENDTGEKAPEDLNDSPRARGH